MSDGAPVRTALYDEHVTLEANLVDFHGFELPIWYSSIKEEHLATRATAGLFDVSHMGSFRFTGAEVKGWLEGLATQRVTAIAAPRCAYTHFLDDDGVLIDDMIFAVVSDTEILGVPNASMIDVMWTWFTSHLPEDGSIELENLSEATSIMALQGPNAKSILSDVLGGSNHVGRFKWQAIGDNSLSITGWLQGTGYHGRSRLRDLCAKRGRASSLAGVDRRRSSPRSDLERATPYASRKDSFFQELTSVGHHLPKGDDASFLARDSWETNVPFGLDLEHEFVGKHRVVSHDESDARWWGIRYTEKGPLPRPGKAVTLLDGTPIGALTSGAPAPSLDNVGVGIGYMTSVKEGDEVLIVASPRKSVKAVVVRPPFL